VVGAGVASPDAAGFVYSRRQPEEGTLHRVVRENLQSI
jgi:hypothetical protein